jgi:hypothetical protein
MARPALSRLRSERHSARAGERAAHLVQPEVQGDEVGVRPARSAALTEHSKCPLEPHLLPAPRRVSQDRADRPRGCLTYLAHTAVSLADKGGIALGARQVLRAMDLRHSQHALQTKLPRGANGRCALGRRKICKRARRSQNGWMLLFTRLVDVMFIRVTGDMFFRALWHGSVQRTEQPLRTRVLSLRRRSASAETVPTPL